ncbi:hypothetical protein OAA60_05565 [Porticoccaceae bacterium]|nr:hypothetical protein [Porticoccaceae bacterium]
MSSASTKGLPFFKSDFVSPALTSDTNFYYLLTNDFSIPVGNYLAWIYLSIQGTADTELGPVVTAINNTDTFPFTVNPTALTLDAGTIVFQNSQLVEITTVQPNLILVGKVSFNNTAPTIAGTIYFYPL